MRKPKVLIVEDEHIIQMDLADQLEQFGCQVAGLASSGEDAVRRSEEISPDLVLMDIRLEGDVDGIQAALQIRVHQRMPIIYLTAVADIRNLGRAAGTEPYFYLVKPVRPAELNSMIRNALRSASPKNLEKQLYS
jgi:DNA-binding response OmpR family regulator